MVAHFANFTAAHDNDFVGVLYGGQSMRYPSFAANN
jgi:hypothetical protein